MTHETYVIRIYRRARDGSGGLVGIVEVPGTHRQASFQDAEQLAVILARPRQHLRAPSRERAGNVSSAPPHDH